MKGMIGLNNLEISCIIGVHRHERAMEQPIFLDLRVEADFGPCSLHDDIKQTIDYEDLAETCRQLAVERKYRLLETFAVELLAAILQKFAVAWAWVRIKKNSGISNVGYSTVELERYRDE